MKFYTKLNYVLCEEKKSNLGFQTNLHIFRAKFIKMASSIAQINIYPYGVGKYPNDSR